MRLFFIFYLWHDLEWMGDLEILIIYERSRGFLLLFSVVSSLNGGQIVLLICINSLISQQWKISRFNHFIFLIQLIMCTHVQQK